MRGFVVVLAVAATLVWFGVPRVMHDYELALGEELFYVDTLEAEQHLKRAASFDLTNPWAHIFLARILMTRGDLDSANEQIALGFGKLGRNNDLDRLVLLNEAGKLALLRDNHDGALSNFQQSLAIVDRLRGGADASPQLDEDAAIGTLNIARALAKLRRLEEALEMAERSLDERTALPGNGRFSSISAFRIEPHVIRMRAVALHDIGDILHELGRPDEAVERLETALAEYRRAAASGSPFNQANRDMASVNWELAEVHSEQSDFGRAANTYLSAIALFTEVLERDPGYPSASSDRSSLSYRLAELLRDHPDLEMHARFHGEVLDGPIARKANDHYAIWSLIVDGDRHVAIGETEEAAQLFRRALTKAEKRAADSPDDQALQREIWVCHLRIAELGLPGSSQHGEQAAEILTALAASGSLDEADQEFLDQARR